jgi:hypothetical protein
MLAKGTTFYHLGYLTNDLRSSEQRCVFGGSRVLTRFASEAFEGRECVFLLTPEGQMLELIQATAK